MARLDQLQEVLFPVEERRLYAGANGEGRLLVHGKKAIVNATSDRVLGVVGNGYRLVTNHEALDWARQCCEKVFPQTRPQEWEVHATDAPATGGHCFIDLTHNTGLLDFKFVSAGNRPDVFGPFIRVTNSYNGRRALTFDIGFQRKVCKNGMIAPDIVIRFKFAHQRAEIGDVIEFAVDKSRLRKLTYSFEFYFEALRGCTVTSAQLPPLVSGVLQIHKPKNTDEDDRLSRAWHDLGKHLDEICTRYANDLGQNAYAAFNAITEFASHPPDNRCVQRERHSFQRLAGAWLVDFSKACRTPGFEVRDYLEKMGAGNGSIRTAPWQQLLLR